MSTDKEKLNELVSKVEEITIKFGQSRRRVEICFNIDEDSLNKSSQPIIVSACSNTSSVKSAADRAETADA